MLTTPNGITIPIDFKGELPYIEHYYPTNAQMRDITWEEIMISPGEWYPSLLDDLHNTSEQGLNQFPLTPINTIFTT